MKLVSQGLAAAELTPIFGSVNLTSLGVPEQWISSIICRVALCLYSRTEFL